MKTLYAMLITLLLCVPALSKEEPPPTITVKASVESIKAELIRIHSNGYKLCKEQPSQVTFCKTPEKPKRAFIDHTERSFTFAPTDSRIEVTATSEVRRVNVFGGDRRMRGMDKRDRSNLQEILDGLKKLETH